MFRAWVHTMIHVTPAGSARHAVQGDRTTWHPCSRTRNGVGSGWPRCGVILKADGGGSHLVSPGCKHATQATSNGRGPESGVEDLTLPNPERNRRGSHREYGTASQ
jgi:hypothetical protein